ncbi:hypothetical protein LguiA_024154 [Lonicera macranthoides]
MDYDFRNRAGPPYRPTTTTTTTSTSASAHPMYGPPSSSLYPKIGGGGGGGQQPPSFHPASRPHSFHQNPSPSSTGIGIRVAIKPEYRITPPPQMSPQIGDIPRSTFQFDFEFERKILAEAEKETQNWSKLGQENLPSKYTEPSPLLGSSTDPVVTKYIASGLSREAVPVAVANYGDNPTKVREFANGYTLLREMGFSSNSVIEALLMYDNDTDKAVAHFLNSST